MTIDLDALQRAYDATEREFYSIVRPQFSIILAKLRASRERITELEEFASEAMRLSGVIGMHGGIDRLMRHCERRNPTQARDVRKAGEA